MRVDRVTGEYFLVEEALGPNALNCKSTKGCKDIQQGALTCCNPESIYENI